MQLDQTRIPIQERGFREIMDLALRVTREHLLMLTLTSLAGAAPFFFLNDLLIGYRVSEDSLDEVWDYSVYFFWLPLLIWWQMPLSATFTTLYLGQVLFVDRFNLRKLLREAVGSLPQLLLYQVLLRGWPAILLALSSIIPGYELEVALRTVSIILLMLWGPIPHVRSPYLNEIILLERNPFKRQGFHGLSTWLRKQRLHAQYGADLLGRWLSALMFGAMMVLSLWLALISLRFYMLGASYDAAIWRYLLPVAIWIVVSYFNVVRFLSYLDLRIRNEGWEIDLRLRAEGQRISRQVT